MKTSSFIGHSLKVSFFLQLFKHPRKLVNMTIIIIQLGLNVSRKYAIMSYGIVEFVFVNITGHKITSTVNTTV